MIDPVRNIIHRYKYGKIVHKSNDGTVIRKKLKSPLAYLFNKNNFSTTKTEINRFGQVEKQLNRDVFIPGNDSDKKLQTSFNTVVYRPFDGVVHRKSRNIEYSVYKDHKKIVDHNVPPYDYRIIDLPDGRKKYEIAYPEVTEIFKDGAVVTSRDVKTYIVDK